MERVVFLIEPGGARIPALLNPESLTITRRAGLRARAGAGTGMSLGSAILGGAQADDPLIATGGGATELELHLLFDTDLARQLDPALQPLRPDPASSAPDIPAPDNFPTNGNTPPLRPPEPDVREMTRPLWNLAEPPAFGTHAPGTPPQGQPLVRFIWGRAWNMPVAVLAVAERLERFGPGGAPQRSWLSLRLRRIAEPAAPDASQAPAPPLPDTLIAGAGTAGGRYIQAISDPDGNTATPLWLVAAQELGSPALWPLIASASGIDDPLKIPPGTVLNVPPISTGGAA